MLLPGLAPRPGPQRAQAEAPGEEEKVPMGQLYAHPSPAVGAKDPAGAALHADEAAGAKYPGEQGTQFKTDVLPSTALEVPVGQGRQEARPDEGAYHPPLQARHVDGREARGAELELPGGQGVGAKALVVQ